MKIIKIIQKYRLRKNTFGFPHKIGGNTLTKTNSHSNEKETLGQLMKLRTV